MFIVKIGGSVAEHIESIAEDLAKQESFILVHGFGPQVDEATRKLGKEPRWVTSVSGIKSRYTDKETIEICATVAAELNNSIVAALKKVGLDAVGMTGYGDPLIHAKRKSRIKVIEGGRKRILEGDYTGKIESIDSRLNELIESGKIPVIPPLALSEENELLNVNGDRAAANIAKELNITTIVSLSDVPGYLKNDEVIPEIKRAELEDLMKETSGGMTIKLLGIREALDFGVEKVIIASGKNKNPVTNALAGDGTVFRNE